MGKSGAAVLERPGGAAGPTDHELVRRVRGGDERAFEALYSRYQRRIAGYVYGMVKDYGRAEDITQEVFVSALRRMRQTERPIAFKPWIYEIAKNACIDAYRRGRRAEEVSFDADDRLSPSDHGRLVAAGPTPDDAVDAKQELDHLCGAFGGLSDSHHQILVMREFEGLSYKDIGERMGMSRPAVESTLFRARKRLGEEYDELASGARCLRIQAIIADAGDTRPGLRDQRKLARHVSHCQPCRRLAAHAGLDLRVPARTGIAGRIAALLPLPAFLRLRRGGDEAVAAAGGGGHRWASHAPMLADSLQSGWTKAAAGIAAVLVAGAGAGVSTTVLDQRDERRPAIAPAAQRTADPERAIAPRPGAPAPAGRQRTAGARAERGPNGTVRGARRDRAAAESVGAGTRPGPASTAPAGARGDDPARPAGGGEDRAGGGAEKRKPAGSPSVPAVDVPDVPDPTGGGAQKLREAVHDVDDTVQGAAGNLDQTVQGTLGNVEQTVADPQNLVPNVAKTVGGGVDGAGQTATDAVEGVGKTAGDLLKP